MKIYIPSNVHFDAYFPRKGKHRYYVNKTLIYLNLWCATKIKKLRNALKFYRVISNKMIE